MPVNEAKKKKRKNISNAFEILNQCAVVTMLMC